jgi:hypothetical protein
VLSTTINRESLIGVPYLIVAKRPLVTGLFAKARAPGWSADGMRLPFPEPPPRAQSRVAEAGSSRRCWRISGELATGRHRRLEPLRLRYLDYQAPVELTNWPEITRSPGLSFFDVGCSASDHGVETLGISPASFLL